MKNLIFAFIICLAAIGCNKENKVCNNPPKPEPAEEEVVWGRTPYQINKLLDSLNAEGCYLLVRGSDRYCDTIIDHVHYIFITEE